MEKERKILFNFTSYILLGLLICLVGLSNVFASTYDSSQFEARLYDNYGTSLQYVTTELIYGWQGNIPHMVANSTGGAWGIQSPIALLKDHTYSITIEIGGTWGGSLILSSKNRVGVGRNYDDAVYSYVNGTNAELKYSKATNGYTLQYAFTAKGDSSYLIIPFATSASGGPWEFRLQNIIIDDLGQDGVTEEEINNSFNNQTNIINNTINNMGEEIKDSIKDTFETCEMSPNLFNYSSYTFDKVVLNAYYFIDLGTFKPNTYYTIYNYNQAGLNPDYRYTFMSVLPSYDGISFTNLAEFSSSTIRTDNTGKLYIGVYSETIPSFTQNDWNNFMSNFQQAMLVEGTSTSKDYQPYGEEKCQNKIDETNDKLNDIQGSLTDSSPTDLSGLGNSAGWLPAGPVDSILTLPLTMLNSLVTNLTDNTCQTVYIELPFVNENIILPCVKSLYDKMGVTGTLFTSAGLIASAFILFNYLLNLYQWVDSTLTMRENTMPGYFDDNWGGGA